MASQALYRRYRSQTFSELIGQEHIVQTLRNALADGRIAHAYLFTGPRGVGKTSVARLLAKAVNCLAPLAERPCGGCESCQAIAEGRAVDVIEMDAASHTSVEDAREIIERVQFRPTNGSYKVYIIDEVHMLSTAAFNALLKTLEEPPGHALFILATTEVHKIPATILSRCQRFTFNRHTIAATAAHLRGIASQEGFTLEPGVAETLARSATGSMRDALSLLDQLMAYGSAQITHGQVQDLLGATEAQEVTALINALISGQVAEALRAVAGVAAQGADLRQFARDVVERLRALMLLKAGGDPALLDMAEDELASLTAQAQAGELQSFLAWVKLFSALDQQLRSSVIPQLPLEMAVIEALAIPALHLAPDIRHPAAAERRILSAPPAVAPPPIRSVAEPAPIRPPVIPAPQNAALAQVEQGLGVEPLPTPAVETALAEPAGIAQDGAPAPITNDELAISYSERRAAIQDNSEIAAANAAAAALERVESIWPYVVRDVRVYDKMAQAVLNSGVRPIDVQDTIVVLEAANKFLFSRLEEPKLRRIIEQVLSKHLGANYTIRCVLNEPRIEAPQSLRDQIREHRSDPLIKAALNIFDADIVAIERDQQGE